MASGIITAVGTSLARALHAGHDCASITWNGHSGNYGYHWRLETTMINSKKAHKFDSMKCDRISFVIYNDKQ